VNQKLDPKTKLESSQDRSGFGSLFSNQQFMSLWIAQIFSQFADRAVFVLFVAVLTSQNMASPAKHPVGAAEMTSWLYIAFTIPAIVLSPVAGVYVDRWSNKTVLIVSNLARAIFVGLVTVPWIAAYPKSCLMLAFLVSIGSQFFGPAETASIPRLVKKDDLFHANSLFFTTMMIALGFGFAIGEPIISQTGIGNAPYAVASGFLIAAILLLGIDEHKRNNGKQKGTSPTNDSWWEELRIGIAYIVDNPTVFRAISKITLLFSTIITLNIIAVGLAEQVMHIQPFQFGYVVAAAGLGMAVGNVLVARCSKALSYQLLTYGGFFSLGLFMSILGSLGFIQRYIFPYFGLSEVYFRGWLMLVPLSLALCIGVSSAFVAVPTQAALQAAVPEDFRGKVFGAQNTAMSAASTIPVVLAGLSTDNLPGGVSTTLLMLGLPTLFAAGYQLSRIHKTFKVNKANGREGP
jgi:predicted MFS family arabinose efflux permease